MIIERGYCLPDCNLEPDEGDAPLCPICHRETDTLYRNEDYEIVGCDGCLKAIDAWDWEAENNKKEYKGKCLTR